MEMCFCCCCAHCSRNCLDCMAEGSSISASPSSSPNRRASNVPDAPRNALPAAVAGQERADAARAGGGLGKGSRKRKPAPMMSKCWHWMMLVLIIFLFGVTMCLLSSTANSTSCSSNASRVNGRRVVVGDGVSCSREYPANASLSYHYEQLAGEWPEWARAVGRGKMVMLVQVVETVNDGGGSGWGVNDSWGASDPLEPQSPPALPPRQCNRNLLQRILDSGIKSMQFVSSQFNRQSCTINGGGGVPGGGLEDEEKDEDVKYSDISRDDKDVVLLVMRGGAIKVTELDPTDPRTSGKWTLSNGDETYHVRIVATSRSSHGAGDLLHRQRPRVRLRSVVDGDESTESHEEVANDSFVVKSQFSMDLQRTRGMIDSLDNNLAEATRSDGLAEEMDADGDDESGYLAGEQRNFHFLRKLQFYEEEDGEGEEFDDNDSEVEQLEEEDIGSGLDVNGQLLNDEKSVELETDSHEMDSSVSASSMAKRSVFEGDKSAVKNSPLVGDNPVPVNPLRNATITLRGLELFLELIHPSPVAMKRKAISPTSLSRQESAESESDSELYRLEQRLSRAMRRNDKDRRIGERKSSSSSRSSVNPSNSSTSSNRNIEDGDGRRRLGKGRNPSAKKCKLNGTSTSCRRRKGMRRKAQASVDNVQFRSAQEQKQKQREGQNQRDVNSRKNGGGNNNNSGDKWRFILENFCAKSHLHGQLPKLIAKLEKQQQQQQRRPLPVTQQQETLPETSTQDHGHRTMAENGGRRMGIERGAGFENEFEEDEEDELTLAAKTTDSLRLEVIKEQILKKLGLKRAPNITSPWNAAAAAETSSSSGAAAIPVGTGVGGGHNERSYNSGSSRSSSTSSSSGNSSTSSSSRDSGNSRRMVEKKTVNFMFGIGPSGIQLPNNNSQFFIHDGHTRPMDQEELFLSKELILATLYRAQLDSVGHHQQQYEYQQQQHQSHGSHASYGQATNRLFDDLHAEESGRGRKRPRKARKRKRKSRNGWNEGDEEEDEERQADEEEYLSSAKASEDLKSHTRRYLEEEFGDNEDGDEKEEFDEEDAFEERNHRYQWENNQQDEEQMSDEDNYGQSREIITFAERGKLLNGRQHLLEFKPVGDHQTPGGDFRIRSAVLWLKVEHLKHPQRAAEDASRSSSSASGRNVTIWIFNMKTTNWESSDCSDATTTTTSKTTTTRNEEKVERSNCPNSESSPPNYDDATAEGIDGLDANTNQELNLNEKDFNRVAELTLTHTIHLSNEDSELDSRGGRRKKNINRNADSTFNPPDYRSSSPLSSNGWHKFDITAVARRWNNVNRSSGGDGQRPINLQLLVDCTGCRRAGVHIHLFHSNKLWSAQQQTAPPLPPLVNENRPFLVAHTEPNAMKRVRRRAVDCSGARNGRCCKQRFYVSFKAIGWDDWIIFPHGYFANYCRGSCAYRSPDMLPTKYSQFMGEFRRLGKMAEMQPCCAPLKFSSMDLIYYDHDRKIIKSNLPQMIVDECGCP